MHVASLYRYPIKGFTREVCDSLRVLPGGRVAGDRVFSLRLGGSAVPDAGWGPKTESVVLVNTPALARLRLGFEMAANHATLHDGDGTLLFDGVLDDNGRVRFAAVVADAMQDQADSALAGRRDALPLRLVGDGVTPRYQDREPGYVTLHSRASAAAVAESIGEAAVLTEQRFRSNVALDGLAPWQEQDLMGRRLRIGEVELKIELPVTRCLATHANPSTGERDVALMQRLLQMRPGDARPTFAVLTTSSLSGTIRLGDDVRVLD
jgi:hypothetical protein